MREYKVLISIMAECEDDMTEQIDCLDCYEIEWWSEVGSDKKC